MTIPFDFSGPSILNVDRALLSLDIQANATGGPVTKTMISPSSSGKERRFAKQTQPRRTYTGSFGPEEAAGVLEIWTSGLGPRFGFMLRDMSPDYQFTAEVLTAIDGSGGTQYQVSKTYKRTNYFTNTVIRTLTRPLYIPDPATTTVFVNGTEDTSFTLLNDGVVQSPTDWTGQVVTATGEFFVAVRPTNDSLILLMQAPELTTVQQIDFIEVLPGDLP